MQFTVKVQPRETGAAAFELSVNGNDIRSQEDAEAHVEERSGGRYKVVSKTAPVAAIPADEHSA